MALKIDEKQAGLTLGTLFAVLHAAWVVIVATGFGQVFINWKMGIYFISDSFAVMPISGVTIIIGLLFAFVIGAIIGWVFAKIWNWLPKQKWYRKI